MKLLNEIRAICRNMLRKLWTRYCSFMLPVRVDPTWTLNGRPIIIRCAKSTIRIGGYFKACSRSQGNSIGVLAPVYIRTLSETAQILIGDNVGVSGCSISARESVKIGNNVLIGSGALITDSDAHPVDFDERKKDMPGRSCPICIEDDVFVGARAIILKGVRIGCGSVVGAGAVVVNDVPPYSVVAGNPAVVVGSSRKDACLCLFL